MIVQLIAPVSGGVRDHAQALQAAWAAQGLPSALIDHDRARRRTEPLAGRLQALGARRLLVHFSGYGYHPRGLSGWLADELQAVRALPGGGPRVLSFFHELFAEGAPPWRSAFWLAPAQARAAARLARLSDVVVTNAERHAAWLRRHHAQVAVPRPVFSNVGEPVAPAPAEGRAPLLVVFGGEGTRRRALALLQRHAETLRAWGLQEVVEVGSGAPWAGPPLPLAHRFAGRLGEAELAALLARAAWGLIAYPSDLLAKSSVYAAYAAHGCVVLNAEPPRGDADGLQAGRHYLALEQGPGAAPGAARRQALAEANRAWYEGHAIAPQAAALRALLESG